MDYTSSYSLESSKFQGNDKIVIKYFLWHSLFSNFTAPTFYDSSLLQIFLFKKLKFFFKFDKNVYHLHLFLQAADAQYSFNSNQSWTSNA